MRSTALQGNSQGHVCMHVSSYVPANMQMRHVQVRAGEVADSECIQVPLYRYIHTYWYRHMYMHS